MLYGFYPTPKQKELPGFSLIERSIVGIFQGFANGELPIFPSQAFLIKELGCSESTIVRALKRLCREGIISKKRRGQGLTNFYQLVPRQIADPPLNDSSGYPPMTVLSDPYNILKEYISCEGSNLPCGEVSPLASVIAPAETNETAPTSPLPLELPIPFEPGDFDATPKRIVAIFDELAKVNPNQSYANKTQRAAIAGMIKNRGFEKTLNLALEVVDNNGKEYFPVVNNPCQMAAKYNSIKQWFERN